jgi:hypothetical protein
MPDESPPTRREPPPPGRTLLVILAGTALTTALWTLITGDLGQGAGYGSVILVVGLAIAVFERRRER